MTTGDGDPVFVDTNVLVFAAVTAAPLHHLARETVRQLRRGGVELWISRQVIREYLATLTRPQTFSAAFPMSAVAADVTRLLRRFRVAGDGPDVTAELLTIIQQIRVGGRQIHDANIVATMRAHGIRRLLTRNVADFARFASLVTVLPFDTAP